MCQTDQHGTSCSRDNVTIRLNMVTVSNDGDGGEMILDGGTVIVPENLSIPNHDDLNGMIIDHEENNNNLPQHHSDEATPVYKEVVVVGNGPSGITLSYLLAGNWPYYNGLGESVNDMLHYRLMAASETSGGLGKQSLVEQDLSFLAQGLEGRSSNPIALLFDTLNHPQADLGLEISSLLTWKKHADQAIDHVVIGKGPPGGAWQSMDGNVLTISRGNWMELPEMSFKDWETLRAERCVRESRATVASVAQYYCDYVSTNNLEKYFLNNAIITEVTLCQPKSLPENCDNLPPELVADEEVRNFRRHTFSGEIPVGKQNIIKRTQNLWNVKGYALDQAKNVIKPFRYVTRNLVLATGTTDLPNILNVKGENFPFVLHSLNELENLISSGYLNEHSDPVMIIGAGLSAADAIIATRFHSIPVVHVYRRNVDDKNLIFKRLPVNMYPEYHKVYQMMQFPSGYEGYKVLEQHVVAEIMPDKRVKLVGPHCGGVQRVSCIVICIGSHPDLSFLGDIQFDIGTHRGMLIDCKRNPLAINFSTHESVRQPGLYAMGPLVGENFVRFLQGGALAISNHLVQQKNFNSSNNSGK